MIDITEEIRSYWDRDSATYDDAAGHHRARTATELAAWSASLRRLLPEPPARILDVGAGTGFLTLLLAHQGYEVCALDLSSAMLARLGDKLESSGLHAELVHANATTPPAGPFDGVVQRHLVWTLPDPAAALAAWHTAAPSGRLVLFESEWGEAAGAASRARSLAHELLRKMRKEPGDHHREYDPALRAQLPLGSGTPPDRLLGFVEASPWGAARIERLRDIEWATRRAMPSVLDRAIGAAHRFAVIAG